MIDLSVLSREELITLSLRALYSKSGYAQYKMSKFEEYDFYARNKSFLASESVITFTDTDGRLLALKPDVTLSIVKNGKDEREDKVYYNENVYRPDKGTKTFKEIMQTGLELIGEVGEEQIAEVITLACRSLEVISPESVLELSHLDFVDGVLKSAALNDGAIKEVKKALSQKNAEAIACIADREGADGAKLCSLVSLYGKADEVVEKLARFECGQTKSAIAEIKSVTERLKSSGAIDKIVIDFSLTSNGNYYNGFAFRGFIEGVPTSVLAGGQYDNLMKKMKRKARAIGFAVYLDEIGR